MDIYGSKLVKRPENRSQGQIRIASQKPKSKIF